MSDGKRLGHTSPIPAQDEPRVVFEEEVSEAGRGTISCAVSIAAEFGWCICAEMPNGSRSFRPKTLFDGVLELRTNTPAQRGRARSGRRPTMHARSARPWA